MDDIAGLKWTSTPNNAQKPAPSTSNYSAFSTLKPTPPTSGRASPFNQPSSQPPSKPATPANDSFANLVGFNSSSNKNLSLQEQQKRLLESKLKQQQAQSQASKSQYAGGDDQFWNNLGSGRATPTVDNQKQERRTPANNAGNDEEDDLFAAFNKPAAAVKPTTVTKSAKSPVNNIEDDDPFGLSEFASRRTNTVETTTTVDDDDDFLGLLGKPASAKRRSESPPEQGRNDQANGHPQDKAVAELVDMGFPAEKARQALETTDSGVDVQAAVGYLLNQAHSEARQKARPRDPSRQGESIEDRRRNDGRQEPRAAQPQRRQREAEDPRHRQQVESRPAEKDFEHMAAEFGNNFLKTAGSLWKQSTKRVQQAVQEFNSDGEAGGQPKWMRDAERQPTQPQRQTRQHEDDGLPRRPQRRTAEPEKASHSTDEALMLETSRPTPPPKPQRVQPSVDSDVDRSRDHSPAIPSRLRETAQPKQPAFLRQQSQSPQLNSRTTLNRQAAEDQAAQAYVSSARRRKPQPQPPAQSSPLPPTAVAEDDLLEGGFRSTPPPRPAQSLHPSNGVRQPPRPVSQPVRRSETPVRPQAPTRAIPSLSAISLQAVHSHREKGNDHFKRGDYSSAHQSYGTSITHLPATHPLIIVLLTNKALTALKIGEPKTAISDSDKAITVIGISKGEAETIDFGTGDSPKPMRDYYGKALMRKAEALEQMEKWGDAAVVWREAVEGGHGGATAIQGRARAEKAANPSSTPSKPKAPAPRARTAPPASRAVPPQSSAARAQTQAQAAAAVNRLRAANAAAEQADDERFALSDGVSARIQAWKGGKEGNLRALLGSLDNVLWEGSGWKKISMADLVLPGKVKIQYMKGIGKVHPDKIPTDATTEQRMIAGAVFSALNEAWDKFKSENGL